MSVRKPAVAGMFYPEDPKILAQQVDQFLNDAISPAIATTLTSDITPKALIVPHAGYVYSGSIAASAYQLLRPLAERLKTIILLGPSHRVPLRGLAAPSTNLFRTPLGDIPVDHETITALTNQSLVVMDDLPHQFEHSLEVQLPFLQRTLNDFSVLPLAVGNASSDQVAKVLRSVWGGEETLIVVSSDLSHYHPYLEAQNIDQQTTIMIEQFDDHLIESQACGCRAINGLLKLARDKGLLLKTLDLRNSGDSTNVNNPDKSRVVGYGAYVIY